MISDRRRVIAGGAGAIVALAGLSVCRAAPTAAERSLNGFRRTGESWTDTWLRALGELQDGDTLFIPADTMLIDAPLAITANNVTITAALGAVLRAAPDTSFEYLLSANGRHGISLTGLSLDVNQARRRSVQRHRFMGLGLIDCASCTVSQVSVQGTLGFDGLPAVAVAIAGEGRSVRLDRISVTACGTPEQPSDGVYLSGDDHLATNIVARRVTDTGVVLEACNRSRIHTVDVRDSSAAAAITNIVPAVKSGNSITGLVGRNLNAPVTGWVQIGCPVATAGDLLDSVVSADLASDSGPGPAINVRRVGAGRASRVSLNARIAGAGAQGILVDGNDVAITAQITDSGGAGIQFQPGSSGTVSHSTVVGGTFGMVVARAATVVASDTRFQEQRFWNMYVYRGGRATSRRNRFGTAGIDHNGHEQGAALIMD